jgi:hypothetical protein
MKTFNVLALLITVLLGGCAKTGELTVVPVENPVMTKNTAFKMYEDLTSPKFQDLKEKYKLDTIFNGENDEFKRQLMLRHWIRTIIDISDFEDTYPGEGVAEIILDEALKGQGYHCGHYMVVQNAIMNSYGYVTRCLGAGPGVKGGPDGHHGVNEVWSNTFGKWYLSDAKYDHHFEKNGIPLSALEVRDEFLKNEAADIVMVKGTDRSSIASDGLKNSKGIVVNHTRANFARTYTWVEYETYNDRYTNWPESGKHVSILTMYEDDFFRNNTWIWDGKPHWAYSVKDHLILESNRDAIEWTPNIIASNVKVEGNAVRIDLESETPNFKTYQMKVLPNSSWEDVPASVTVEADGDRKELVFRAMNVAGAAGPEHKVILARAGQK